MMRTIGTAAVLAAAVLLAQAWAATGDSPATPAAPSATEIHVTFDDVAAGSPLKGWRADATNPQGSLAEWQVVADPAAPTKPNVLSITKIQDASGGVFNLFWTKDIPFKDGMIEVKVRANTGWMDQGGGLMWRVVDAKNYYVARGNPMESNFRLYVVKDGVRKQLAGAENLGIKTGEWFTMRIVHRGDQIEGYLNGKKLLDAADKTFADAGGVGFWTKADAASSFDDLVVQPAAMK